MPRYVRLSHGEHVEAAIEIFGNRVRVSVVGYLRENGPATRSQIAEAIGAPPYTTLRHLGALVDAGVLSTEPPTSQRGQWVKYALIPSRITELYTQLGEAIGEPSPEGRPRPSSDQPV